MPDKAVKSSGRRSLRMPAALLGGALFMTAAPAVAQVGTSSAPGAWTFNIAPYFWLAGVNGKTGVFGQEPVEIDENFGDILQTVRFGGMVVGEAHNGTWGV